MDIVFEEMGLEHLDQVLEIEKVSFPSPWSRSAFAYELLQNNFACYLVALAGDRVVGYGGMWLILDEAHITNIAVHPDWRMKQIGRALMREMMRLAVTLGINRMTLEVRPSNAAARRLYTLLGFGERGMRKRYYTDTNEDAIIMWNDDLSGGGPCLSTGHHS